MVKESKLPTPKVHARLRHADENTSDYLEAIAELIADTGEARVVDLAQKLGVSKATVTKKVGQLQREGYVRSEPYRSIFLEPRGKKIAAESKRVHRIVLDFLLALRIPQEIAEADAEGIEHHVSTKTITALESLTEKIRSGKL